LEIPINRDLRRGAAAALRDIKTSNLVTMIGLWFTAFAALGSVPSARGASLLASHFSGSVYTLDFTQNGDSGNLTITSSVAGCGVTPAWLQLYPDDKKLYCFDESWTGRGTVGSYNVASDGRLSIASQMPSVGNDVHGRLYGGSDGKGFVAAAQ
jgi:hypothetical protein